MSKYSIKKLPDDILKDIAAKHRFLRKQKGYSQQELAERSGVSFGSVKRFEQTGQIALASLLKLLAVLDRLQDMELILNPKEDLSHIEQLFNTKKKV